MRATMTKKELDDKREPRLDQVVSDNDVYLGSGVVPAMSRYILSNKHWQPQVCNDKSLENAGPLVVVNLMKIKDPETLAK